MQTPAPLRAQQIQQAAALHRQGRLAEAEALYQAILAADPRDVGALHLLGVLRSQQGRHAEAAQLIGEALRQDPHHPAAHGNLGNVLNALGRHEEAVASCQQALALRPDYAEAHNNLAQALNALGRHEEAVASCQQALALSPDHAQACFNLGTALSGLMRHAEAVACYERALALRPGYAEAHNNLGMTLVTLHRHEAAIAQYRRAVTARSDYALAHHNLGNALASLNRHEEALACYRSAIAIRPDYAEAHNSLGNALAWLKRQEEALASYQAAVAAAPGYAEAHYNLGNALYDLDRYEEAVAKHRQALALRPDFPEALNNLGFALLPLGRAAEASAARRRSLAIDPQQHEAHSALICIMGFDPALGPEAHLAERQRWEEVQVRGRGIVAAAHHPNRPDPQRRLRVGYVSGDFQYHSAATAFAPALLHYDRSGFEVICYANNAREDFVTARLRQAVDGWRPIHGLPDEQVAQMIGADAIDILVDLSGHTVGNRLLVFARKPAPVQVSAWGHCTGTGLTAIDYLFSDAVTIPLEWQRHFVERVVHLPCVMNYTPQAEPPAVAPLPVRAAGHATFGYFNNYNKLSEAALECWGELLAQVPTARLLLKARELANPGPQQRVLRALGRAGIAPGRVEFLGGTLWEQHMGAHARVDIALDPFPFGGGVSTLEALWMGVPVVTLKGAWVSYRTSAAILSAAGLPEWIAETPQQYVEIAARAGRTVQALEPLRAGLRERLLASPLGDPALYARALEARYRELWRAWCRTQSPAA